MLTEPSTSSKSTIVKWTIPLSSEVKLLVSLKPDLKFPWTLTETVSPGAAVPSGFFRITWNK